MSEWWTYRLSDFLLFSPRTYYRLFELYNAAIWPGQVLALLVGLVIVALLLNPSPARGRVLAVLLAACWLWVAWGFLFLHYATINWAATYFAAAFAFEALLFLLVGAVGGGLMVRKEQSGAQRSGLILFLFALLAHPLIGPLLGRTWSTSEIFGLAPDPTALGTLGILLCTNPMRWGLLAIPFAWCLLASATLWTMEAPDAWTVIAASVLALGLTAWKALYGPR
jgi:Family of unknown function (DUF6064)